MRQGKDKRCTLKTCMDYEDNAPHILNLSRSRVIASPSCHFVYRK
jgi:hypothetical protein